MTLGVLPEARRCGIGRSLMYTVAQLGCAALHTHGRDDSVVDMHGAGSTASTATPATPSILALDCMSDNGLGQALYRSIGMAVARTLPNHYLVYGDWHDGVRMEAALPLAGNYVAQALASPPTEEARAPGSVKGGSASGREPVPPASSTASGGSGAAARIDAGEAT